MLLSVTKYTFGLVMPKNLVNYTLIYKKNVDKHQNIWYNRIKVYREGVHMRKLFTVLLVSTLLIVGIQKEEATSVSVAKPTITATPTHSGTEQRTRLDRYYDIPLSRGMQRYTRQESTQREIPYELVLAVMQVESNFDSDLISKTNDYGLMQINKCNHKSLQKVFGKESFLNPQFNVKCGTYLLSTLYDKYHGNIHKTLMAYNMGEGGMNRLWKKGIHSSKYSRKVVKIYETYTRTK